MPKLSTSFEKVTDNQSTGFSTTLACPHFSVCSGCQLQADLSSPPIAQEIRAYFQGEVPIIHGATDHWRLRSKLPVRGTSAKPEIGLFKRGTHDVVSIPDCAVHHPLINKACAILKEKIQLCGVAPYDESNLKGYLRYVQMVVERSSGKIQLALIVNNLSIDEAFIEALAEEDLWHSIWVNFHPVSSNRIFGDEWVLCRGDAYLWERLGGVEVAFHPACFGQAHLALFEQMLASIKESLLPDKKIVEFYAGVGAIGLSLAGKYKELTCTEINPFAEACFQAALEKNQYTAIFKKGAAREMLPLIEAAEVIIVDPPRKGLDKELLQKIIEAENLEQIIYVSCGWRSFQSDSAALLEAGWKLAKIESYLLFPGTDHLEILAIFTK